MVPSLDESYYSDDESSWVNTIVSKNATQGRAASSSSSKEYASIDINMKTACKQSDDAFLYYSNDDIRLKTLKLQEVDDTAATTTSRRERKTRISFEIDPLLVLGDDLLDELFDDEDDEELDIDFSQLKNDGQSNVSKLNLLAELLQ